MATGDPYSAPDAPDSYLALLAKPLRRLKIGFSTVTPLGDPLDAECVKAIEQAAADKGVTDFCASVNPVAQVATYVPGRVDYRKTA